jgi:hypothetical protein
MGYFARHWRGELSLPVAYWVNNVLLMFPLGIGVGLLMAWISAWGESLQMASIGVLVGLAGLAVASIWAPVGAWRSAVHQLEEGGPALWPRLTQVVVGLGLVVTVANVVFDVLPELPAQFRMAAGRDPIGSLDIRLAADGRSVVLSGPFGMGASSRFEKTLKNAPQLRRVVLQSPGGRLFEAHQIAGQVRARGLQTRAEGDCASACTLVFIAGQRRSVAPKARLGFHRASVASHNPLHDSMANQRLQGLYEDAGLPPAFIGQVLLTPASRMWFPALDTLVAASILPPLSLRPELDAGLLPVDAPAERYRDALTDNALWAELEVRQPGLLDAAAQRMQAARARGLALPEVGTEAQAQALSAVPLLLKSAGPRSLEAYIAMLAAELRAKQGAGDAACQAVLAVAVASGPGGAAAPSEHLAQWLQQALLEAPEAVTTKPLSPLEIEVLRKELGPDAPERIAVLVGAEGGRKGLRGCAPAIQLLDAMARLRGPQRRLAMRLMLQSLA